MPSAEPRKKDLTIAKCMQELNGKVSEKQTVYLNASEHKRLNSIKTLHKEANSKLSIGDEELAYLCFMRAVDVYKSFGKPPVSIDKEVQKILSDCIQKSEELSKSLQKRYERLNESKTAREKEHSSFTNHELNGNTSKDAIYHKHQNQVNGLDSNGDTKAHDNLMIIQPTELYDLLVKIKNGTSIEKVMLLDVRKSDDYINSHIDMNKLGSSNVKLINIPEEKVDPHVVIVSKLSKLLSPADSCLLENRKSYKIILFDWFSKCLKDNESFKRVYECFTKWDTSKDKCSSSPIILENGYNGWLASYPTFTTNPRAEPPLRSELTSKPPIIDNFYSTTHKIENNSSINGDTRGRSIENGYHESKQENNNNNNNNIQSNTNGNVRLNMINRLSNENAKEMSSKIPGSAQLVPIVNRAIKPKLDGETNGIIRPRYNNTSNNNIDGNNKSSNHTTTTTATTNGFISEHELKNKRQIEAIEEMNRINMQVAEEKRLENQNLRKENEELKKSLAQQQSKSPYSMVDTGAKEDTSILRKSERTLSESNDTPRNSSLNKTTKGLSRSFSSPNIADHEDDDDSDGKENRIGPPTFDRSLKPSSKISELRRFADTTPRSRNFSSNHGLMNAGLKNLGNTCFMNAVLQCLADTVELRRYFMNGKHMHDINRNNHLGSGGVLAEELGALVRDIRGKRLKTVSPNEFKDAVISHMPSFVVGEQQDAHEFFCMLLEKIHADLNRAKNDISSGLFISHDDLPPSIAINKFWNHHTQRSRSIIAELFEGLLMSSLKCTYCNKQSNTFEVFTNLSLPIPTNVDGECTLAHCLDLFTDEERLTGEAAWRCPNCKAKREAIKRIKICKLPKILVIHLKRFSYEGKLREKIQNQVEFPLNNLNLGNNITSNACESSDPIFDLYGVVHHTGTLEGGHYVAYCKDDEKWYEYDDHKVTKSTIEEVKSQSAYLLFYTTKS